jgi:hypothetical protein
MKWVVAMMLALCVCASAFGAKIFKWVDDKGHVQYTTTPPPEATMDKVQKTFDYVPPSPEEKALAAMSAAAAAQQYEANQRGSEIRQEVDKLSRREYELTNELDSERWRSSKSIGHLIEAKGKMRWIQRELDSVRQQKRALLGHESQ